MADTIYILGAGINQGVKDRDGFAPPLAMDFFVKLLGTKKYSRGLIQINNVMEYIDRYWKFDIAKLKTDPFDLEEIFTLIQLQKEEAFWEEDIALFRSLSAVGFQLMSILAERLSEFSVSPHSSDSFMSFGRLIYEEQATVITFNYDTLLESAIATASGVNDIPQSYEANLLSDEVSDDQLPYSHCVWNIPLAYGFKFDEVILAQAGIPAYVSGDRFYRHKENELYPNPILKLHGSLNWFRYSGVPLAPVPEFHSEKTGRNLIGNVFWRTNLPPMDGMEILEPLIITPVLYKQLRESDVISEAWKRAKTELSTCRTLICGGYSFPPTDFHTKRLFLESFETVSPEQVVVINPDPEVAKTLANLCHVDINNIKKYRNLDEYIHR